LVASWLRLPLTHWIVTIWWVRRWTAAFKRDGVLNAAYCIFSWIPSESFFRFFFFLKTSTSGQPQRKSDTKHRTPMTLYRQVVRWRIANAADRKCRKSVCSTSSGAYEGAVGCRHRCIVPQSLHCIHWGTSSQRSSVCSRCDRPRSCLCVCVSLTVQSFKCRYTVGLLRCTVTAFRLSYHRESFPS